MTGSRPRWIGFAGSGTHERFCRLWRLYLSYCEAGFAERRIGSVQMVLAKPRWRGVAGQPVSAARNSARAMISR